MKKIIQLMMFSAVVFMHAQTLNAGFAINKINETQSVPQPAARLISYENEVLSPAQIITYLIQETIDTSSIEGEGKQTTMLIVTFGAGGVLENATANGDNTSLNHAAAKVMQEYVGKPTRLKAADGKKVKLIIPISINL